MAKGILENRLGEWQMDIEREMNQVAAKAMQQEAPGLYSAVEQLAITFNMTGEAIQRLAIQRKPEAPVRLLIQISMTAKHIREVAHGR